MLPFGLFVSKKRGCQHGRLTTGLSYRTTRATRWMACPSPSISSVVILVFCWGWGSFVSVFGGRRLEWCQSTSRHGTCRCYAQSSRWCTQQLTAGITNVGDPRLVAKQPTACQPTSATAVHLTQPATIVIFSISTHVRWQMKKEDLISFEFSCTKFTQKETWKVETAKVLLPPSHFRQTSRRNQLWVDSATEFPHSHSHINFELEVSQQKCKPEPMRWACSICCENRATWVLLQLP